MKYAARVFPIEENGQILWKAQSETTPSRYTVGQDAVTALLRLEDVEEQQDSKSLPTEIAGTVSLYTDGACSGNPGIGGWSAILQFEDSSQLELSGGDPETTNNRMELLSVICGLKFLTLPRKVHIYSDSQYVVKTMTEGWRRNKNQELWDALDTLADYHTLYFHWVKGHAGNPFNERCDSVARAEIAKLRILGQNSFANRR